MAARGRSGTFETVTTFGPSPQVRLGQETSYRYRMLSQRSDSQSEDGLPFLLLTLNVSSLLGNPPNSLDA